MASLANCLVLSFRPRAQLHKLKWHHIRCESQGVLEKVGHKIRFTRVTSKITLTIAKDESKEKARQLLEKAEQACFISNSLSCQTQVSCEIVQNA